MAKIPMTFPERLDFLARKRHEVACKYAFHRRRYGKLKADLDIILASKITEINEIKRNSGYETSLLIMLSKNPSLSETYRQMIESYNNYKAISKMIDSLDSRIMTIQSIMRYEREQT